MRIPVPWQAGVFIQDSSVHLGDDTSKIFLNAAGEMDDVNGDLKAFLDYVAGKKPEDSFVDELEEAVKKAKKNREWRHEYMTLLMRDQDNVEKGMELGMEKGILGMVSSLRDFGISDSAILEKVQEKFNLPLPEAKRYMAK